MEELGAQRGKLATWIGAHLLKVRDDQDGLPYGTVMALIEAAVTFVLDKAVGQAIRVVTLKAKFQGIEGGQHELREAACSPAVLKGSVPGEKILSNTLVEEGVAIKAVDVKAVAVDEQVLEGMPGRQSVPQVVLEEVSKWIGEEEPGGNLTRALQAGVSTAYATPFYYEWASQSSFCCVGRYCR